MTFWKLVLRNLWSHRRAHFGAWLGAVVGATALSGALYVGDSVRFSLREIAMARLGKMENAALGQDRFFRDNLSMEIGQELDNQARVESVLINRGSVSLGDGSARANQVQIIGVDAGFWEMARSQDDIPEWNLEESRNGVWINQRLATQLNVQAGDTLTARMERPTQLSRDAPLSPTEDVTSAMRVEVAAVLSDQTLGRFGFQSNQTPPFNLFLPKKRLQEELELSGSANALVSWSPDASSAEVNADSSSNAVTPEQLGVAMEKSWTLEDAQLILREPEEAGKAPEVRSDRVFLDENLARVALGVDENTEGILTYLVNGLTVGEEMIPYSMVTAWDADWPGGPLADNEILLIDWMAEHMDVKEDDELTLTYYVVGPMRRLEEQSQTFKVKAILPKEGFWMDPTLMPDFPGLTDADNCRDWDTGFAIDNSLIEDRDEEYWDEYKGTPKAFISLKAGQEIWKNRFGALTAVRYPGQTVETVRSELQQALDPSQIGITWTPVREQALKASVGANDFGGLFIGFSFFLITAALLLVGLLFQFGIERRVEEIGTLVALGFPRKRIRQLLASEAAFLTITAAVVGAFAGLGYGQWIITGLTSVWQDAVASINLFFHARTVTIVTGAGIGAIAGMGAILLTIRKQTLRSGRELLMGVMEIESSGGGAKGKPVKSFWAMIICCIAGIGLAASQGTSPGMEAAPMFFGAGGLLLVAGIAGGSWILARPGKSQAASTPNYLSLWNVGWRGMTRRRKRSLATLGLLACGSFLIAAINANRLDAQLNVDDRSSGSGGFAMVGSSSLPVSQDLNSEETLDFFGLDPEILKDVKVVPFRTLAGDEASCLNLNQAQRPKLLAVDPTLLAEREAFRFSKTSAPEGSELAEDENPWTLLNRDWPDENGKPVVPAIGDMASIQWAMKKSIGATIEYEDENGKPYLVKIVGGVANSTLQGTLVVGEDNFLKRHPSHTGYSFFLIDAPFDEIEAVSEELSWGLQDYGLELTPSAQRLAELNAVQNTYLSTFQALGGLGLLLGSVGLGVVVLRNLLERRAEIAVMTALGFKKGQLRAMTLWEHGALLTWGLLIGIVSALVAIAPVVLASSVDAPFRSLTWTLIAIFINGWIWTLIATFVAFRGKLLNGLRDE